MTNDAPAPAATTPKGEKGITGKPNGRTARFRKLKAMNLAERKAHRVAWKAALKKPGKAVGAPAPSAPPPVSKMPKKGK